MEINLKTQDFIRGKVLDVPDYEEWKETHSFPENEAGEQYVWSNKLVEEFKQFKASMYLEDLPVTNMAMTNKGRLDFSYYHHAEDNMYHLGSAFTGCTIEQLEQLSLEDFKKIISERMVSSKIESNSKSM